MTIRFGPAGIGPVKTAEDVLEMIASKGLKACEIAFTYGVYIKNKGDAEAIGKKAKELGIELSIHAPYYVNLNSDEKAKREATKKRILACCETGHYLGAKTVVFHPGYYSDKGKNKAKDYGVIKEGIIEIMDKIKKEGWKIKIAPETMGKINVFGSVEEISKLAKETGCAFCLDFAHILAREKKVNFEEVKKLFPQKEWHCHFSGIEYGEKGEKNHKVTEREEWESLIKNLPKDRDIVIINESPSPVDDSVSGLKIYEKLN